MRIEQQPHLFKTFQSSESATGETMSPLIRAVPAIDPSQSPFGFEIDGGVTVENASTIVAAGTDVLVAGNTVFKSADPKATIQKLKQA